MPINKDWHLAHLMPKNPTLDQRLVWHLDHLKHCTCRAPPESILSELKKRKML